MLTMIPVRNASDVCQNLPVAESDVIKVLQPVSGPDSNGTPI